ncbi:EF-hand domain-containing protein [Sphingobium yanoikuyae]|nr:EF-hand domain-containing protein [Sphingobium yanoikuyae]
MIRTLLLTSAMLVAAPALAQQAAPADPAAQAAPASPAEPQAAQPANPANSVAAIVESEFPAYDTNKDGQLDQGEFSRWMVALKDQEMKATGKTLPPAEVTAWASGAFTTADADKSISVSKPELISYLSGSAGA